MKILNISTYDIHSSRFNGYAMRPVLQRRGHRVRQLVWDKQTDDLGVTTLNHGLTGVARRLWRRATAGAGMTDLFAPTAPTIAHHPWFRSADVAHAHLIDNDWLGVLSAPVVARRKPLVVTVHSAVAATGGCYHPFACEAWRDGCRTRCPHPRGSSRAATRTPALLWQAKARMRGRAPLTLVAGSPWVLRFLQESPLTAGLPSHLIPFGLDLEVFKPTDKAAARTALGLPPVATVLAFRGQDAATDQFKGITWLRDALAARRHGPPEHLLVFQSATSFRGLPPRYVIHELGDITEPAAVAGSLAAADLFLMPTYADSFGMMAVESMACGTPVICGEGTAVPDTVFAPRGGIAVPQRDVRALATAIDFLLARPEQRAEMAAEGRTICEQEYRLEVCVNRHLALYEQVRDNHLNL